MLETIKNIIGNYTETPMEEITLETNLLTDLGMQSIDFVDMICDFEEEFDYQVPERDFRKLTTVKSIIEYIESKKS